MLAPDWRGVIFGRASTLALTPALTLTSFSALLHRQLSP
jgi:hypothetical protein